METGVGEGGGGPAPFLLKTYDMVDDPASDAVVSWSEPGEAASFVVWNPPEFAARLLPTYFKHNNFSSFIRQLNTYGFHKIDPERWEFANEYFVKGQKHLLKNIHRRKPIHSHSHPAGSVPDANRMALEEEIERLNREKIALQAELSRFNGEQTAAFIQIEDLERRVFDMEQRQLKMLAFLHRASEFPQFLENLVKVADSSVMFSDSIHKKRRLPSIGYGDEVVEMGIDDHSSSSRSETALDNDFSNKLKLGLCHSIMDSSVLPASNQSSDEDNESLMVEQSECERMQTECRLPAVPETLELCDTGTSFCPLKNNFLERVMNEGVLPPCQLNLSLASSADIDTCQLPSTESSMMVEETIDLVFAENNRNVTMSPCNGSATTPQKSMHTSISREAPPLPSPAPANDKFWEKFFTEIPGSSDNTDNTETEEASPSLRADASGEDADAEGDKMGHEEMVRSGNDLEQLKL